MRGPVFALVLLSGAAIAGGSDGQPAAGMQRIAQFDNARAASWTSVIPPHTESDFHRHDRRRVVVAVIGGDLKTVTPAGRVTITHFEAGKAYWFEPMPPGETHKDLNDTDKTIEVVTIELK